jgi:hypothetical protein
MMLLRLNCGAIGRQAPVKRCLAQNRKSELAIIAEL